jgi:shikimate kinase
VNAHTDKPIVLIGFMGSGKTSVGRELSRLLGLPLVDLDRDIEEREGMAIVDIFGAKGEPYFRTLESAILEERATGGRAVICSGGGIVLAPQNVETIRECCISVWLKVSPQTVYERVKEEGTRPILNNSMTVERIASLMAGRLPLYAAAARFSVETDGKTVEAIAEEVAALLTS